MLSKKMAFSLMSLITIFALAFVAPSVIAQDFDTTLSVNDVSSADGNQVYGGPVEVTVTFGKVVNINDISAKISLLIYNKFGGVIGTETATDGVAGTVVVTPNVPHDGKTYLLSFGVAAGTNENDTPNRARLRVTEGIVAAAPDDAEKSRTADIEFYFIAPDPISSDPMPIGIELANNLLVPADGFTGDSFDIIVTLSEQPKDGKFTKDHLDVDKGTAGDSVYLGAIDPPQGETATGHSGDYHRFLFTITPKVAGSDLVIKIKSFEDQEKPIPNKYIPPVSDFGRTEGTDMLTVKIKEPTVTVLITVVVERAEGGDRITPPGVDTTTTTENQEVDSTVAQSAEKTAPDAAAARTAAKSETMDTSVPVPTTGRIYISEIMFARGPSRLPQWIEISNESRTEQVNLSGWTLTVENATADADVSVGAKAVFTIPEGTRIDPSGQNDTPSTVLVVTDNGRNNLDGWMADGQVVNLWVDQQVELILLDISNRRYSLLSDMAFRIMLAPPPTAEAMDVVGNLADDGTVAWALPISEGTARSSILRRHVSAEPKDGEMMESWVLASDTGLAQPMDTGVSSYYGLPTDIGTPGFRAGGALPVELSYFRPVRDKATGTVVITWSTQSELNNAGFYVKRSQQHDGEFVVVNPTMVLGAGTTSEKQFYTYTDTTAQPNLVYYYQIEDVSLDGNRQTLTRGIRLKGHIGAAGKATTTWGEIKTSNE